MKWLLYILGGMLTILIGFVVFVWVYTGGVNVPLFGMLGWQEVKADESQLAARIRLPEGFSIGLYAADVPNARMLKFTDAGDLLVANPNMGRVVLLEKDNDGDRVADGLRVVIAGLNGPNGLDFHDKWLYIAESDAIGRVPFDHDSGTVSGDYERIVTELSGGGNHWQKTLRFGPDGLMYVTMGSSCNVCIEEDNRRAALTRYNPDGSGEFVFATGMRNSAGFDWSPDGRIFATDNGRDLLGDDFPPCELNLIEEGKFYGWPFANGDNVPDPDFGEGREAQIAIATPPVHGFRPHNAPLGIQFLKGETLPVEYRGAAIVALHGSWNRSEKDGYKVVSLHFDANGMIEERDFVSGFLVGGDVIGRPVEIEEGPDGAIFISDDFAGAVYRVAYNEERVQQLVGKSGVAPSDEARAFQAEEYDPAESLARYTDAVALAEITQQGQGLFGRYACGSCHSEATNLPLQRLGHKYDVAGLTQYLARPKPPMPAFPMSDVQKEALAVYLISSYP